jgi:hypothetical protein
MRMHMYVNMYVKLLRYTQRKINAKKKKASISERQQASNTIFFGSDTANTLTSLWVT